MDYVLNAISKLKLSKSLQLLRSHYSRGQYGYPVFAAILGLNILNLGLSTTGRRASSLIKDSIGLSEKDPMSGLVHVLHLLQQSQQGINITSYELP